jgi:hypothetical protein
MKYEGYYLAFFAFIGIIIIVVYFNIQQQQELSVNLNNKNNINTKNTINTKNNINTIRCIKKDNIDDDHNRIYKEYTSYKTTKDINNYTYNINNIDFDKDIVIDNNNKLGNPNKSNYEPALEKIYNTKLKGNNNNDEDNNELFDYSIRPNKTDLPIVNPPLQLLKANAPLRLSERHFF